MTVVGETKSPGVGEGVAPEQGQLVSVRGRAWIVSDVRRSAHRETVLDADALKAAPHFVTLTSVEDDGIGDEIDVLWELEPGARVIEKAGLPQPDGFDDPALLDVFLRAVQWGASSTADLRALLSPYRSGIEIEDYQLDPVVRAIQMPRACLLIADDVGLGKTIEAGLVIQEFLTRHRARTALVVCPASLQIQWQEQMRDKFGLEFRIIDSEALKDLRRRRGIHVNPWSHFPRLITSMDFLKRERPLRLFRELLPGPNDPQWPRRFDILVVDEAHNVAPSGRGAYAVDSQRTQAIRTLAPHFEHRLFLSATPHNGFQESFTALLELLDDRRFARTVAPDRKQLDAIMIRRLKRDLPKSWDGTARFAQRELHHIPVPYDDAERAVHTDLVRYTELRHQAAKDEGQGFATDFVLKLLKKRLFSSPASFLTTLKRHRETMLRGGAKQAKPPTIRVLRHQAEQLEADEPDSATYDETLDDTFELTARTVSPLGEEEGRLLERMTEWAAKEAARPDAKARKLLEWLEAEVRPGGNWSENRVIIFTEYRQTLNYLMGILAAEGLTKHGRLETLHGAVDLEERERIKNAFLADPAGSAVRILLATDTASEGIDLQRHCSLLIHYEIPWNPNRMEQRNGRIDRYGQPAIPKIYHFVDQSFDASTNTADPGSLAGDLEFIYRAVRKLAQMERDLFGKVAPVIEAQVEKAMLGLNRTLDTSGVEAEAEPLRRLLRVERDLAAHIGKLHERMKETRHELAMSPENVRAIVETALSLRDQPGLIDAELDRVWPDPSGKTTTCPVFHLPRLDGAWAKCSEGLAHPHTGEMRPLTFDEHVARGRDDVVLAHLNHRLVRMSLRLLRSQVWATDSHRHLHRVTARIARDTALDAPALIGHARLVVVGADGRRLHEELITAGGILREGRFRRLNLGQIDAALGSSTKDAAPGVIRERMVSLWPKVETNLLQALEARMKDRTDALAKALAERCAKEQDDVEGILRELRERIGEELGREEMQLDLFGNDERDQFHTDRDAIRRRHDEIPQQIADERAAIAARFAEPTPRIFPVAVTWLVPEGLR